MTSQRDYVSIDNPVVKFLFIQLFNIDRNINQTNPHPDNTEVPLLSLRPPTGGRFHSPYFYRDILDTIARIHIPCVEKSLKVADALVIHHLYRVC